MHNKTIKWITMIRLNFIHAFVYNFLIDMIFLIKGGENVNAHFVVHINKFIFFWMCSQSWLAFLVPNSLQHMLAKLIMYSILFKTCCSGVCGKLWLVTSSHTGNGKSQTSELQNVRLITQIDLLNNSWRFSKMPTRNLAKMERNKWKWNGNSPSSPFISG